MLQLPSRVEVSWLLIKASDTGTIKKKKEKKEKGKEALEKDQLDSWNVKISILTVQYVFELTVVRVFEQIYFHGDCAEINANFAPKMILKSSAALDCEAWEVFVRI